MTDVRCEEEQVKVLGVSDIVSDNGDRVVEIMLEGRRVGFFIEPSGRVGWFLASKADYEHDGSGYFGDVDQPGRLLDALVKGLTP